MRRLTGEGMAILMISSDLPEVLGMSDRVLVMNGGRIVATFETDEATPEAVGTAMTYSVLGDAA
jgi:ABC-type sugar transport system ATPase subunit